MVKKIDDIQKSGDWIDLKAKVVRLWNPNSNPISQIGLLGDETGQIKFISWKKSNLPELKEGKSYQIKKIVTDKWQDKLQVNLNKMSKIRELDERIEVKEEEKSYSNSFSIKGEVTRLTSRSGTFLRCPECKRSMENGVCLLHGEVEPIKDLRVGLKIETDSNENKALETSGERAEKVIKMKAEEAHSLPEEEFKHYLEKLLVNKSVKADCFELEDGYLFANKLEVLGKDE